MLTDTAKKKITKSLKRNRNWLKIELRISIFGVTILHLTFPPSDHNQSSDLNTRLAQSINPNF